MRRREREREQRFYFRPNMRCATLAVRCSCRVCYFGGGGSFVCIFSVSAFFVSRKIVQREKSGGDVLWIKYTHKWWVARRDYDDVVAFAGVLPRKWAPTEICERKFVKCVLRELVCAACVCTNQFVCVCVFYYAVSVGCVRSVNISSNYYIVKE